MPIAKKKRNRPAKPIRNTSGIHHAAVPPARKIEVPESQSLAGYLRWKAMLEPHAGRNLNGSRLTADRHIAVAGASDVARAGTVSADPRRPQRPDIHSL